MTDWNAKVQETADKTEAEVRKLIDYMNDEVVPDGAHWPLPRC